MKIVFCILLSVIVWSCNSKPGLNRSPRSQVDLNYIPVSKSSGFLSVNLDLSANVKSEQLTAEMKLINSGPETITITAITLLPQGGMTAFPNEGNIKPVVIQAGKDTLTDITFNPVNDVKVYQATGRQGHLKPEYKVSIAYKVGDSANTHTLDMTTHSPANDYDLYSSRYAKPYTTYSFNTATNFNDLQKRYMDSLKLSLNNFAFVAQQELALTGVNIWMKAICENDSITAEFLVVNHDAYRIKIDPDSLDFLAGPGAATTSKAIVIKKLSGSVTDKTVLEKNDRALITLKKYFIPAGNRATLCLKHAFMWNGKQPLFCDDIGLVKVSLP
ncbi:MAG: hypothetical protein JST19_19675 [Bacteroidetes bacterium]|nr:hypothetical protein [Bacteroidota bacterium]